MWPMPRDYQVKQDSATVQGAGCGRVAAQILGWHYAVDWSTQPVFIGGQQLPIPNRSMILNVWSISTWGIQSKFYPEIFGGEGDSDFPESTKWVGEAHQVTHPTGILGIHPTWDLFRWWFVNVYHAKPRFNHHLGNFILCFFEASNKQIQATCLRCFYTHLYLASAYFLRRFNLLRCCILFNDLLLNYTLLVKFNVRKVQGLNLPSNTKQREKIHGILTMPSHFG